MIRDGRLFKRYEVKPGKKPPAGFEAACDVDPETGKQQGWLAVGDKLEDRWHQEAFERGFCVFNLNVAAIEPLIDGTYELVGPKISRNPNGFLDHYPVAHGECRLEAVQPRSFQTIRQFLEQADIEESSGIIRMADWSRSRPRISIADVRETNRPEQLHQRLGPS